MTEPYSRLPGNLKPGQTPRIGVISNPKSGLNRKGMHTIRQALAGRPQTYHFETKSPSEMREVISEFAQRGVDVIAVNGGDATVHRVLTELFRQPQSGPVPVLALLRSGTANMIARDVGLSGPRQPALERLLKWAGTGCGSATLVERPVLKVEWATDREPLYGMFFGAACICQGIQFCLTRLHTKGVSGQLAAGLTLARFLMSAAHNKSGFLSPVPISVGLDNEPSEKRKYLLLMISTLERLFLGLRPYWGAETAPLYYTALEVRPRQLVRALPSVLRGRRSRFNTPEKGYFSQKVRAVRLTYVEGFTLDGELYAPDTRMRSVIVSDGGKASFLQL